MSWFRNGITDHKLLQPNIVRNFADKTGSAVSRAI